MDKNNVFNLVVEELLQKIVSITQVEQDTQQIANEAEGAMQTRYGSTKEEAQELKNGYSVKRMQTEGLIQEIQRNKIHWTKKKESIQIGTLCKLQIKDQYNYFLILPFGGITVILENKKIFVLAQDAPVAKLLIGKKENDEIIFNNCKYKIIETY